MEAGMIPWAPRALFFYAGRKITLKYFFYPDRFYP